GLTHAYCGDLLFGEPQIGQREGLDLARGDRVLQILDLQYGLGGWLAGCRLSRRTFCLGRRWRCFWQGVFTIIVQRDMVQREETKVFVGVDRHRWQCWRRAIFRVAKMALLELGEDRSLTAGLFARCLQEASFRLLSGLLPAVAASLRGEIFFVGNILVIGAFRRDEARYTRTLRWRLV